MSKLFVCGYWPVSGNLKRSSEHYNTLLPQTLQLIRGEELVFYSSSEEVLSWAGLVPTVIGFDAPGFVGVTRPPAWTLAIGWCGAAGLCSSTSGKPRSLEVKKARSLLA